MRNALFAGALGLTAGVAATGAVLWEQPGGRALFAQSAPTPTPGQLVAAADITSPIRTINVSGEGRVSAKPDQARITLGALARAGSVQEAMDQAQAAIDQIVSVLKAQGVADADIQTASFYVNRITEGPNQSVTSYQANQQLSITVRDLSKISTLIGAASQAAGDRFQMNGVQFLLVDTAQLQTQARQKALEAARTRAQDLARLQGVTLGPPIATSEGVQPPTIPIDGRGGMGGGGGAAPAANLQPGENEYVVTVAVSYAVT
jgi:uncharacterized protein YggE